MSSSEYNRVMQRAAEWKQSREMTKQKLADIVDSLDTWHAVVSGARIGSSINGIASATLILAAPFTGGASLAGALAVGGFSVATSATSNIIEFTSTKSLCSDANKLLEKHQRLTESLKQEIINYGRLIKSGYDLAKFVNDLSRAAGITIEIAQSATVMEQIVITISNIINMTILKVLSAVSLVLNVVSMIQTCKDIKQGSKFSKQLTEIMYQL